MKNNFKILCLFIPAAVWVNYAVGQETNYASNIRTSLSLDKASLVIEYDIVFPDTTQLFDIMLQIEHKGTMIQPREADLHGVWGTRVKPGLGKGILWDFTNVIKANLNELKVDVIAVKTRTISANFDFNILNKKPPYEVKFTNKTKNADAFSWKFGDVKSGNDNVSILENPVHKYKSGGDYNVELIVGSSRNKTSDTILKVIALGNENQQMLLKHKKMRTIWLGSAVVTAGIGGYSFAKYSSTKDEWRTEPDRDRYNELEKKYKTYAAVGTVAAIAAGVCITEVFIQTKKIKAIEQKITLNYVPLKRGAAVGLALKF